VNVRKDWAAVLDTTGQKLAWWVVEDGDEDSMQEGTTLFLKIWVWWLEYSSLRFSTKYDIPPKIVRGM
jgi:hypothetical protein